MTDYNRSEAYDLSLFAEPAIEPTPEPQRRQQPVRQPKPKQAPHSRTAPSASLRRVLGIFAVSIMLIGLFGGIIAMRISLESLTSEAATLRNKISVAESENVRLTMHTPHARIYDRLLEICVPISCIGVSFRKETAQEKLERMKRLIG